LRCFCKKLLPRLEKILVGRRQDDRTLRRRDEGVDGVVETLIYFVEDNVDVFEEDDRSFVQLSHLGRMLRSVLCWISRPHRLRVFVFMTLSHIVALRCFPQIRQNLKKRIGYIKLEPKPKR